MVMRLLIGTFAAWHFAAAAFAAHIPLDVPDRRDYAFDRNGILYISTNGGSILRYDTRASSFLEPYAVGGRPLGIDLSLDGSTLAVADSSPQGDNQRIVLVDTASGTQTEALFPRYSLEHGTFMVAWGADNRLLVSSEFSGSGNVRLRRYDPATNETTILANVRQDTMLAPSADRRTIGLVEPNISTGPFHYYDVATGELRFIRNTDRFLFEVAVNRDGSQFIVPTGDGFQRYERDGDALRLRGTTGSIVSGALAAVYSPVADVLFTSGFAPTGNQGGVFAYTFGPQHRTLIEQYPFEWSGSDSMDVGRLETSPDGRWLAVSVDGGIRLYDVSAFLPVPEPSSMALVFGGTFLLTYLVRRSNVRRP